MAFLAHVPSVGSWVVLGLATALSQADVIALVLLDPVFLADHDDILAAVINSRGWFPDGIAISPYVQDCVRIGDPPVQPDGEDDVMVLY
jgi:hypothetical protein